MFPTRMFSLSVDNSVKYAELEENICIHSNKQVI